MPKRRPRDSRDGVHTYLYVRTYVEMGWDVLVLYSFYDLCFVIIVEHKNLHFMTVFLLSL